jgi:hypothetical protein
VIRRRLFFTGHAALALALAMPTAAGAQGSAAVATMRVSAEVVSGCRILQIGQWRRVEVTCTKGIPVEPRVRVRESQRGSLHVINF